MVVLITDENGNAVRFEFRMVRELLRQEFLNNPLEFFNFLGRFKIQEDLVILCDGVITNKPGIQCSQVSDAVCFRTMICEYIYRGINCFDLVDSYTIHCKNNICKTDIIIGHQPGKFDDQNMPAMLTLQSEFGEYHFNYDHIYEIYIANRIKDPDFDSINALVILLYMTGEEPKVSISYTIRKDIISTATKF